MELKKLDAKTRRVAPLRTPTDLGAQATKEISAALNLVLGDAFALCLKTNGCARAAARAPAAALARNRP